MRLLLNRNFAILLSGQLVSTIGNNLFSIALPWYVYALTNSKSDLALTGIAQTLPALAGLVAGVWVDRWRKKAVMISSDAIRGVLSGILFVLVVFHWPLWTILLLVLMLQVAGQFFNPASGALFPLLVAKEDVAQGSGLLQSSNATAQLVGTVSGGALMGSLGVPLLFLLDAVSFFVSVISLFFIRLQESIPGRPPATAQTPSTIQPEPQSAPQHSVARQARLKMFVRDWIDGLLLIGKSKFLILIISAALVANFAFAPMDIAITAWVKGPMNGTPLGLGIINGGFFVGIILGGIFVGFVSKHVPMRVLLLAGLIGLGTCAASFGAFYHVVPETVVAAVAGYTVGTVNGALNAMFIQVVPEAMRGRAFGIMGALSTFAMPLGMALFGVVMIHLSLQLTFIFIGLLCVLSGLSFLLPVEDDRTRLQEAAKSDVSL